MISAGMKCPHQWVLILGLTTKFRPSDKLLDWSGVKFCEKNPAIPTTIKTMGVNITTIAYLRVLIIEIGSTIVLMVVEAQNIYSFRCFWGHSLGADGEQTSCSFLGDVCDSSC